MSFSRVDVQSCCTSTVCWRWRISLRPSDPRDHHLRQRELRTCLLPSWLWSASVQGQRPEHILELKVLLQAPTNCPIGSHTSENRLLVVRDGGIHLYADKLSGVECTAAATAVQTPRVLHRVMATTSSATKSKPLTPLPCFRFRCVYQSLVVPDAIGNFFGEEGRTHGNCCQRSMTMRDSIRKPERKVNSHLLGTKYPPRDNSDCWLFSSHSARLRGRHPRGRGWERSRTTFQEKTTKHRYVEDKL